MVCLSYECGMQVRVASFLNLVAAWVRKGRDVAPSAPLLLRMFVHELIVAKQ
jgi:hypothetical protein